MQTDSNDLNNILAQMPTPVSNNIRASSDTNSFMSPLQVDQQSGYDRINGVQYNSQPNDEVRFLAVNRQLTLVYRCSSRPSSLLP
jgi:hypothetical protein